MLNFNIRDIIAYFYENKSRFEQKRVPKKMNYRAQIWSYGADEDIFR